MKYMLIMRSPGSVPAEAGASGPTEADLDTMLEQMGRFHDEMIGAGVLLAMEGLADPADGAVVDYASAPPVVTDGPYGEARELFGGFYLLDVSGLAEAVEWGRRIPMAHSGAKIEIRRVASLDVFPQDNIWIQKERAWREATGQR